MWNPPLEPENKAKNDSTYDDAYYTDKKDIARYPTYPMEPMMQAVLTQNPKTSMSRWDIVSCEYTVSQLLRFSGGSAEHINMVVEALGRTVFFRRDKKHPLHPNSHLDGEGYGIFLLEKYTSWGPSAEGSQFHRRAMEYEVAGMKCLVRCEVDGFLPERLSGFSKPTDDPKDESENDHENKPENVTSPGIEPESKPDDERQSSSKPESKAETELDSKHEDENKSENKPEDQPGSKTESSSSSGSFNMDKLLASVK